jgi:hypothetical protein
MEPERAQALVGAFRAASAATARSIWIKRDDRRLVPDRVRLVRLTVEADIARAEPVVDVQRAYGRHCA